jgi:diguanylate cyclase (GGDEF)-like protein
VAPARPVLLGAVLAVTMVYVGLMVPRPFAEIGIAAMALAYAGSEFVIGIDRQLTAQVAGVAVTDTALGVLILGIRIATERGMNERTLALAAANKKLELLSLTDPLTGLANRRGLANALSVTWQHAETTGRPVGIIMLDIDHFKQYNDRFGHPGGDGCLQKLATILKTAVRETDIAARYGGEEFAVVLPDADLEIAHHVAERIRQSVAELGQEHPASPTGHLTVSGGVASAVPGAGVSQQELLQRADDSLYAAKRNGRNQIARDPAAGVVAASPPGE